MATSIIIPVDLSQLENAQMAIDHARKFGNDATLILLHVIPHFPEFAAAQVPSEILESHTIRAKEQLQDFARKNGISGDDRIIVREGHPGRQILNHAKDAGADVIVIASHDPGWGDIFLGSVAAFVVRHAHCSVFVVRNSGAE